MENLRRAGREVRTVDEPPRTAHYRTGKQELHISAKKGDAFDLCASYDERYLCCRVHVLRVVSNCPSECSYCFLQSYLTDSTTWVVGDTAALMAECDAKTAREPWRFFRVGTWELGDSLALEPVLGTAAELVRQFAKRRNLLLELRTKSDAIDSLLDLSHGGRTVVSWTMNPERVVRSEELRTASVTQRLDAMRRVADAGYLVGVHFDPLVLHDGWEDGYEDLVRRIVDAVGAERIPWISLGSLRFPSEMRRTIEENYPRSRITTPEMVLGGDGKVRYVKPLRLAMYRHLLRAIRTEAGDDVFVYLCMERFDVWERVLGLQPRSSAHVDYLLTASLNVRYPGLVHRPPEESLYAPHGA